MDIIGAAVKEGLDIEGARRRAMEAREFAEIPGEGPMACFFLMNVESLYRALAG